MAGKKPVGAGRKREVEELARRMKRKAWFWKRKSSEKTLLANEKLKVLKEKELELERSVEELNEQLSSVRTESRAKDDLLGKQEKFSKEAAAGWKRAKAEALSFRRQLDDALLHKQVADKRVVHLEAAIKECMQQLRDMKEDQQLIIKTAAMKISREQEKIHSLEEMLSEANKKLSEGVVKNSYLSRILVLKEQLIEDLGDSKSKSDANYAEVAAKLDVAERNNSSLRYEVFMLQKELEIRNKEKESNLRSADAAHRRQLESVKKIAKLESECQRLCVMIRKRLPGPAALAKMRNEVEMLGNNIHEAPKKKSNTNETSMLRGFPYEVSYDALSKNASSLTKRLHAIEDENRNLKDSLTKKSNELQATHVMFAHTTSKIFQVEAQLEESSKGDACHELTRTNPVSCEMSLPSMSENGGDENNFSCSESWASALISELENFRSVKSNAPSCRSIMSDFSLMDDFVEVEKLTIVSLDNGFEKSSKSCLSYKGLQEPTHLESVSKKLVQVENPTYLKVENQISNTSFENYPNWLQEIIRVIIEKHQMEQRSLGSILDEVRIALTDMKHPVASEHLPDRNHTSKELDEALDTSSTLFGGSPVSYMPNSKSNTTLAPKLETRILKLIELVEGLIQLTLSYKSDQYLISGDDVLFPLYTKNHQNFLSGYVTHTFLWKCSELSAVLQKFLVICCEFLHGESDVEKFTAEVASCLEWIINHCFSVRDVSDMKESIKKHLHVDELQGDYENETLVNIAKEMANIDAYEELDTANQRWSNGLHMLSRKENIESMLRNENEKLKSEIISVNPRNIDLEGRSIVASNKNDAFVNKIQDSEQSISNLRELAAIVESKSLIDDNIKIQKLGHEDHCTQLTVGETEPYEARQKVSALTLELEEKSNHCEEIEAHILNYNFS